MKPKELIGSREIKFRAIISPKTTIYFTLKDLFSNKFSIRELLKPWLLKNKPDRYTGLKDKNGTEIYEGDIVKGLFASSLDKTSHVVSFVEGCFGVRVFQEGNSFNSFTYKFDNYCEVVGNVFENPELL